MPFSVFIYLFFLVNAYIFFSFVSFKVSGTKGWRKEGR